MKRAPHLPPADPNGSWYWRNLDELAQTPQFMEAQQREFPEGASELIDPFSRRSFLSLMGASAALAGLTACRRPEEKILPYSRAPEEVVPGVPQFYATAMPMMGTALGLLVESHEGRPTKVEGNPHHPESLGAVNVYAQSLVLDLYDPDRSTSPQHKGRPMTWLQAADMLQLLGSTLKTRKGKGLWVVTGAHRSPTLAAALTRLRGEFPEAHVVRFDPFPSDHVREGTRLAFARPLEPVYNIDKARVILALDSDFLVTEGSPVRHARGFARGRKLENPKDSMNRLYAVEGTYSVTGANADHRLRLEGTQVAHFAAALARELATTHGLGLAPLAASLAQARPEAFDREGKPWIRAVAKDLVAHRAQGLIIPGRAQPPVVHALCNLLNHALGNVGTTVEFVTAFDEATEGAQSLVALTEAVDKGEVDTLLFLDVNPVFTAPGDVDLAAAVSKAPTSIHVGTHVDETAAACAWHLNRAHDLESWSDLQAVDGTVSVVQPLIAPLYGGRTDAEILHLLMGQNTRAYDLVRSTWAELAGGNGFEKLWRQALHEGVWPGTSLAVQKVEPRAADVVEPLQQVLSVKPGELEVVFRPDSHTGDGRWANCAWLQEMPDPMTKLTWDNAAWLAPATAAGLNVKQGDVIGLSGPHGRTVEAPVVIVPGHADGSITLTAGQGRAVVGRVGKDVGFNAYPLRRADGMHILTGVKVEKVREEHKLAITQGHHVTEGRPVVRGASLKQFQQQPDFAQKAVPHPPLLSLFPDYKYEGHKWGMVIDLNSCIGCNACMVACQAENNIPVVGKFNTAMSREMHWIRVDRYWEGQDVQDPRAVFQPVPCMQCENAPCEQVCPVAATTHSPEGLNDQAYNRCIGTRYCANNCPYKVRRFNFFNYAKDITANQQLRKHFQFVRPDMPEVRKLQFNPDVTVRSRGVMEKCTYCVQRINGAKIAAKREGRDQVREGEVRTACQQTCPAEAIHFGDLNDPKSAVAKQASLPRNYGMLEELNVRPRTTYLAKVRNPNPELEKA